MEKRESLLLNNQFVVSIGSALYSFSKVSNLSNSIELETINQGGVNQNAEFLIKQKNKPETLILEKGLIKNVLGLNHSLMIGDIVTEATIMVKRRGKIEKIYSFEYGIVSKWEISPLDAMGKDILIQKLEITHTGLEEFSI